MRCVLVTGRAWRAAGDERAGAPSEPLSRSCQMSGPPIGHARATMADPSAQEAPMAKAQASSNLAPGTIVVGGTGRVAVEPDVADLQLGVSIARPTVNAARADAAAAMTSILAAVRAAGVADP